MFAIGSAARDDVVHEWLDGKVRCPLRRGAVPAAARGHYRGSEPTDQMNFTKDCREIRSMLPTYVKWTISDA
jgi:hypothetical protein